MDTKELKGALKRHRKEQPVRIFVRSYGRFGRAALVESAKYHGDGFEIRVIIDDRTEVLDWKAILGNARSFLDTKGQQDLLLALLAELAYPFSSLAGRMACNDGTAEFISKLDQQINGLPSS